MGFVKVVKNKAYFKRFQVKYRRRREGKTDYYARKRLITQDGTKYHTPKYRLVARITNKNVIAQVVYSRIEGDFVVAAAYSSELPKYGIKVGLTNWASCYAVGLLLARRVNAKLNIPDDAVSVDDESDDIKSKKLRCFLDVGLRRTTTGSRIFAIMKGAVDGGLDIPHGEQRLPYYSKEDPEGHLEVLERYIHGEHVSDYMTELEDEDEETYQKQFSRYISNGISADNIREIYENAHEAIRADPSHVKKVSKGGDGNKKFRTARLTLAERKAKIAATLAERA